MEALKLIPYVVLMLAVSGLIAGAAALSLSKFNDTLGDSDVDNKTGSVIGNASAGLMAVAEQFPTIGVIAVMVIIISLIAGVFVYFKYFG